MLRIVRHQSDGFTLIELSIVIAIIVILYAIATPSLRNIAPSSRLKSSARKIRSLLTYARDVAMTEDISYLVIFDLDEQRYWLASSQDFDAENPTATLVGNSSFTNTSQQSTSVDEEGNSEGEAVSMRTAMVLGIPEEPATGVEISAVNVVHNSSSDNSIPTLEQSKGLESEGVSSGVEYIYFTPAGTSEDMVLYLQDKTGKLMSVRVKKETGQVFVKKESQNISRS